MKDFLKAASFTASGLLTLFGLFQLAERLYSETTFGIATVVFLLLAITIVPTLFQLARLAQLRHFGVLHGKSKRLCLDVDREIAIDAEGRARHVKRQKLVFLAAPKQEDLWDGYSASSAHTLEDIEYISSDSAEVKRQQRDKNILAIFWRPNKPIITNHPYDHETSWISPLLHKDNAFFSALSCVEVTGVFREKISTARKMEKAIAFRRSGLWKPRSDLNFMRCAFRGTKDRIPQPKIQNDGHLVLWEIIGPDVGTNYFCVLFFEGGEDEWRKRVEEGSLRSKIHRLLQRKNVARSSEAC